MEKVDFYLQLSLTLQLPKSRRQNLRLQIFKKFQVQAFTYREFKE